MIPAAIKALQDEVQRLIAKLDELQAKCERQEELLRDFERSASFVEKFLAEHIRIGGMQLSMKSEIDRARAALKEGNRK
jgi:multidrug resistance efflux pump